MCESCHANRIQPITEDRPPINNVYRERDWCHSFITAVVLAESCTINLLSSRNRNS